MTQPSPEISIILPSYNEAARLKETVAAIQNALITLNVNFEIILVNDGSLDNTAVIGQSLVSNVISFISYPQNQGKGYAVKKGMLAARGRFHLFMDVDLATSLDAISEFYQVMTTMPVDILIGDRKSDPQYQKVQQPSLRRLLGKGFTQLSKIILHCPFNDFTCGFKMFTQKASKEIFSRSHVNRWSFDSEVLFIAQRKGYIVKALPVIWRHQPNSKVNIVKDVLTSFNGLIQIRRNELRGLYN